MIFENLLIEFYLTPNGWVRGKTRSFQKVQVPEVIQPPNTVETFELHIYRSSLFFQQLRHWRRIWKSEKILEHELTKLHHSFPKPDEHFQ
ncbi:hypothetical protein [Nostoc sp. MG11]|jgi:hypothetical protein|uniref:hypothetical protein n=1 Tax=Nostoc sp. MG11 TaxID=2721166 RepID=UPI001868622D|nr:hypothetical protein [Nostoc sp. MG11]MBW4689905.1 hypothetical protein [Komarekiella atlantica HA4396-MV6]